MDMIRATYSNGEGVEEVDKEIGTVVRKKDPAIEFNDAWMDGDRLKWTSAELDAECVRLGVDEDAYKHQPSSAPTHFIICESPAGRKIIEDILMKHIASGEFIINGSFIGTARRVAAAAQADRPLFVFQHTGGCADLASVMLDQVKLVQRQHAIQVKQAQAQGKTNIPRVEDMMSTYLPFDPFKADDPSWICEIPALAGRPKISFTGVVGNIAAKSQVELMSHINACFANFPSGQSNSRLIIDPFVSRGAELQDLISRTMCSAGDGNHDELNGDAADKKRLQLAWEMHGALENAADKQEKVATVLQATTLILSFMTLAIAQIRSNMPFFLGWLGDLLPDSQAANPVGRRMEADPLHVVGNDNSRALSEVVGSVFSSLTGAGGSNDTSPMSLLMGMSGNSTGRLVDMCNATPDSPECQVTYYASIVIPLIVTALLTFKGRFDPDAQVVELRSGAARIEFEIYKFRTRTGAYGRAALAASDSSEAAQEDDQPKQGTGLAARERFRISITAIWDGLMKSVVTEHSSAQITFPTALPTLPMTLSRS